MLVQSTLQAKIQQILYNSMKAGFEATFLHGYGREGMEMAEKFASTISRKASGDLAKAITDYIKTATIMGGMTTVSTTYGPAMGPITTAPTIS